MQPLNLLQRLRGDMIDYVSSKYPFRERGKPELHEQLMQIMSEKGTLFQDPVIQLVRSRKNQAFDWTTFSVALRPETTFDPYIHQIKAWENIRSGIPTVVATGTGSGKSECFMFPMLDNLIKVGFAGKRKVGAICLYPMNALVEDQYARMQKLLERSGLTVGIYNGSYKNKPDCVEPDNPETIPNVLLTNYKMLEYMLLRAKDQPLFQDIDLRYLVLDEAHTYTGTLGLEIACLLARLRVHLGTTGDDFLPIATSATLMQKGHGEKDLNIDPAQHRKDMRLFFSKLFGREFPDDKPWLIEDEYESLPELDTELFRSACKTCKPSQEAVKAALADQFPRGLWKLASLYFNIDMTFEPELDVAGNYDNWASQLYVHCLPLAKQLPGLILRDSDDQL